MTQDSRHRTARAQDVRTIWRKTIRRQDESWMDVGRKLNGHFYTRKLQERKREGEREKGKRTLTLTLGSQFCCLA